MDRDIPRLIITVGQPPGPVTLQISEKLFRDHPDGNLIIVTPTSLISGKYSLLHYAINWDRVDALFTKEAT